MLVVEDAWRRWHLPAFRPPTSTLALAPCALKNRVKSGTAACPCPLSPRGSGCMLGRPRIRRDPSTPSGGRNSMEAAILAWLHDVAIRAFGLSLFVMLAINGVFAVIVLVT